MISLLLCSFLSTAQAVPMQLSQQGRLVDSSGAAAAGNHNLTFRLYNASTGGTLLWNETVSTNFTNGYYSVVLGSDTINNPLEDSVLESGDLYIEIEIDSDGPLTPRSAVTSAPFARVAGKAQVADSVDWSGLTSVPSGLDDADTRLAALETLIATLQTDLATTQSDLATTQSDLATANGTIASLQASVGTNTTDIASNASDITGLDSDLTAAEGSITSLQASVTTNTTDIASVQSDMTTLQGSVLDLIDTDTTWNIGSTGDYTDLEDAMAAARSVRIHPDATLTLQMANDIYTVSDTINLNHPDGANIVIQGSASDPALVQLEFSGTNGFYMDSGHAFGGINDLTIRGDSTGSNGIILWNNATLSLSKIIVEDFAVGLHILNGSSVWILDDSTFQNNNTGLIASYNSIVFSDASPITAKENDVGVAIGYGSAARFSSPSFTDNTSHGLDASHNSTILSTSGTITNNGDTGAYVNWGTFANLNGTTFDNNGQGVQAMHKGIAYAPWSTANGNDANGYVAGWNGSVYASNSTANNNGLDGFHNIKGSFMELLNSTANNNSRYGILTGNECYLYEDSNTASGNSVNVVTYGYVD